MGKVTMHNPQSGVTQEASRAAFDRNYSQAGWVLVAAVDEPEAPADEPDEERRQALLAEAAERGIRVHPNSKIETIERKLAEDT